ncbi:uncharacterized protein LOC116442554 isoform X2 [Corvus moneduloides]|uniref:uncharacterized protein LOC116442554 isoform X2 n=1 Tax=Corvus moneduloides TaxID=1196302 RepID=UPI0013625234|nr:uncharacterized protein LOC116442554 isoform X2 [Corvus moneduloides]
MCKGCVRGVSRVCPGCVPGISGMCRRCVRVCPGCVRDVSQVYPGCVGGVSECVQGVSEVCPGCVRDVSEVCTRCIRGVSEVCPGCVQGVSEVCPRCVRGVSEVCLGCVQGVSRMCPGCVRGVSRVCLGCVQGVSEVYPCVGGVSEVCPGCFRRVSRMCRGVSGVCRGCVRGVLGVCPGRVRAVSRLYRLCPSSHCPVPRELAVNWFNWASLGSVLSPENSLSPHPRLPPHTSALGALPAISRSRSPGSVRCSPPHPALLLPLLPGRQECAPLESRLCPGRSHRGRAGLEAPWELPKLSPWNCVCWCGCSQVSPWKTGVPAFGCDCSPLDSVSGFSPLLCRDWIWDCGVPSPESALEFGSVN